MEQTLTETPLESPPARSLKKNDKQPAGGFSPLKNPDFRPVTPAATYVSSDGRRGNLCWRRDERRGRDQIILTIYEHNAGGYSYSIQAKLGGFVFAQFPHQAGIGWESVPAAKRAAIDALKSKAKGSLGATRRLKSFDLSEPLQRELFESVM